VVVLLDGLSWVDLVCSSGLWPLDEMRRSTLGVAMCDEMEETFHYDVREGRSPKPCAEDLEDQVDPVEWHHLDVTVHMMDLYI
jgi:hypothetical protein